MSGLLPIDLVLVRHGESEGNLAQRRSKQGDESDWSKDFKERHTSKYRLTDLGRRQAVVAGKWIKDNIGEKFDRFFLFGIHKSHGNSGAVGSAFGSVVN